MGMIYLVSLLKFYKQFSTSDGPIRTSTEPPIIASSYYIPYFSHCSARKSKFFGKCILSKFLNNFSNFLLILIHIFEKLPYILGLCPIVKFRFYPQKSDRQTCGGHPQPKNPAYIIAARLRNFGVPLTFTLRFEIF